MPEASPYTLRHSFCSLLLHEGRSVIYVARQMGHDAKLTLGTYGHVIDELEDAPRVPAEDAIRAARAISCVTGVSRRAGRCCVREAARTAVPRAVRGFRVRALCRTRTGDPFLTMEVLYQLS